MHRQKIQLDKSKLFGFKIEARAQDGALKRDQQGVALKPKVGAPKIGAVKGPGPV